MKKNTAIERTEWIISESNTDVDGIIMHRFLGTENEVKKILLHLVKKSEENDPYEYEHGTEDTEEVESEYQGHLYAYASFSSYHIDFTAVMNEKIKSLKYKPVIRYIAKKIKWDTDGDQDTFDSLPQEVILPAKFSKENYEDENGFFGEAEKIEMQDDISDWLSNEYGFCHDGFELTQKEV